jgi:hypothetical protein
MPSDFSAREGLLLLTATGDTHLADDHNAQRRWSAALGAVLVKQRGGEGVYGGGAAVLADLPSGTQYPAVTLVVDDDGTPPVPHGFDLTSATAINFDAATIAAATLYAVIDLLAGVSPAAAEGGRAAVSFVAQATADDPPAHSLPLGSGAVASSAFTSFTPAANLFRPLKVPILPADPASPANGDQWIVGSTLKVRLGGVTKTVTVT